MVAVLCFGAKAELGPKYSILNIFGLDISSESLDASVICCMRQIRVGENRIPNIDLDDCRYLFVRYRFG